jgi:acetylglutamate kinase
MVNGRRITDLATLDIITMVYAGLINKNIVADLNAKGAMAIGVCGVDANLIIADKRPVADVDYGFVGDIKFVNGEILMNWLGDGFCPVISPVTHDGLGQLLNTNADTIASSVALAISKFSPVRLVYCFEKKGVLMDINDEASVISILDEKTTNDLKNQGLIHSGMLPKIENAIQTVKGGVDAVFIGHADELDLLIEGKTGTKIISK